MPDPGEFPGTRRPVVPLVRARHSLVGEVVTGGLPAQTAVVGTLDELAEPAVRLGGVDAVLVDWRALQVVDLPAGKERTEHVPVPSLAVGAQDERSLARADQDPDTGHLSPPSNLQASFRVAGIRDRGTCASTLHLLRRQPARELIGGLQKFDVTTCAHRLFFAWSLPARLPLCPLSPPGGPEHYANRGRTGGTLLTMPEEGRPGEGRQMIPMLMIHSAERSRTMDEHRRADDMTSEFAAALAQLRDVLLALTGSHPPRRGPPGE